MKYNNFYFFSVYISSQYFGLAHLVVESVKFESNINFLHLVSCSYFLQCTNFMSTWSSPVFFAVQERHPVRKRSLIAKSIQQVDTLSPYERAEKRGKKGYKAQTIKHKLEKYLNLTKNAQLHIYYFVNNFKMKI